MLLWSGLIAGGVVTVVWALVAQLLGPTMAVNYWCVFVAAAAGAICALWIEWWLAGSKRG